MPNFCPIAPEFHHVFRNAEEKIFQCVVYRDKRILVNCEKGIRSKQLCNITDVMTADVHSRLFRSHIMGGAEGYSRYLAEAGSDAVMWRRLMVLYMVRVTEELLTEVPIKNMGDSGESITVALVVAKASYVLEEWVLGDPAERSGYPDMMLEQFAKAIESSYSAVFHFAKDLEVRSCPYDFIRGLPQSHRLLYETVLLTRSRQETATGAYAANLHGVRTALHSGMDAFSTTYAVTPSRDVCPLNYMKNEAKKPRLNY